MKFHHDVAGPSESRRLLVPLLAFLAALFIALSAAAPAQAYNFTGAKWTTVNPLRTRLSITYGGTNSANAWINASSDWTATSAPVSITRPTTGGTPPVTLSDQKNSSVSWDGLSNWYPGSGTTTNATGWLNVYYTAGYSASTRKGVAGHELGHIMGLAHNSGCVLMVSTTSTRNSCAVYIPKADDIAGINALY